MTMTRWLRKVFRIRPVGTDPVLRQRRSKPQVEALEDRTAPATFTVTSATDNGGGGQGTLTWAIQGANANAGSTIDFNINNNQGTEQTITLTAALPAITKATLIDGFSQGVGQTISPWVELHSSGVTGDGLDINAGGVTVQGLAIDDFNGNGIVLNNPLGTGDLVKGCYIGTDLTGTNAQVPNQQDGILIQGGNNTVGDAFNQARNVISGNNKNGIELTGSGATGNQILGNFIGVDNTGIAILGNGGNGVRVADSAANNSIGTVQLGNTISGNSYGVWLDSTSGNTVTGNIIGLGSDGTTVVGNTNDGVEVVNGSPSNTIGAVNGGNVISGNKGYGIHVATSGVQIMANCEPTAHR